MLKFAPDEIGLGHPKAPWAWNSVVTKIQTQIFKYFLSVHLFRLLSFFMFTPVKHFSIVVNAKNLFIIHSETTQTCHNMHPRLRMGIKAFKKHQQISSGTGPCHGHGFLSWNNFCRYFQIWILNCKASWKYVISWLNWTILFFMFRKGKDNCICLQTLVRFYFENWH